MVKETKYGVISDVHRDPRVVQKAIEVLKKQGAEKLLVNGDIGESQSNLEDTQNYVAFILNSIGKSGLEAFVQPGSHETLLGYGPVIDHFADQYDNIFDTQRISHVNQDGHQLVFLPGSDYLCGGEYQIGNGELPSGRFMKTLEGLFKFDELGEYVSAINKEITQGAFQYANMQDIKRLITEPEKTIAVCHIPRKFNNLENAVDIAEFGIIDKEFFADIIHYQDGEEQISVYSNDEGSSTIVKPKSVESEIRKMEFPKDAILSLEIAKQLVEAGAPISIRKENRGNVDLAKLYDEIGIKKAVSGHFHESGHTASDKTGNYVKGGEYTNELFWNSGCLDLGQTGILTVKGDEVKYQNILL